MYGLILTFAALVASPAIHPVPTPPAPAQVLQRSHAPRRSDADGSDRLFSLRARRRFAAYLRIRLLEMREAGLDRAARVIERKLPIDALLPAR